MLVPYSIKRPLRPVLVKQSITMPPKTSGKAAKKSSVMNSSKNQVFSAQHRLCPKFDGTLPYSVSYPVNVTELQISDLDYGYIGVHLC